MALKRKSPAIRLAAFCLRFLLLATLGLQLILLCCQLLYGFVPLPTKRINGYLEKHSINDLHLSASSYRLRLNGQIEAIGLLVFRGENQKPILKTENAKLSWSIQSGRTPALEFTHCVLSGGTLYQPAVHSPDGIHSILLSELAIDLEIQNSRLLAHTACAKLDDWIFRGQADLPKLKTSADSTGQLHPLDFFYKIAAQIQTYKTEYNYLEQPTIDFKIHKDQVDQTEIYLLISTETVKHSNAHIEQAALELALQLDGNQVSLKRPALLSGGRINLPSHRVTAINTSCWIPISEIDKLTELQFPQINLYAQNITYGETQLNQSLFQLEELSTSTGRVHLSGSTSLRGAISTISGNYDLTEKSGNLQAAGTLTWPSIIEKIPKEIQNELPALQFTESLEYEAKIDFAPNKDLKRIRFDVETKQITFGKVLFDRIQAKGLYEDHKIQIDTLRVDRNHQDMEASGQFDTDKKQFNILVRGNIQPKDYNSILPLWWGGIFKKFSFNTDLATKTNFAVRGALNSQANTDFFGEVKLTDVTYREVPLEEARISVKGTPSYIQLDISKVESSEGSFTGSIDMTRRQDGIPSLVALHLDIETELSIDGTRRLIGELLYNRTVGDFSFTSRPKIKLSGSTYFIRRYPEYRGKSHFSFQADANGPLQYGGAPIDYLQLNGYSDDTVTQLRDINFGYADGFGNAVIDIWSRPDELENICFKIQLNDADDRKAIENLPVLDPLEDDFQTPQEIESKTTDNTGSGSLDASLHAKGSLHDPFSFSGNGSFTIRDKQLGAIQLLGPLSTLLQGTVLGFTSFQLHEMTANVSLEKEIVEFTDLQANGPLTRIDASGSIMLESKKLDMRVAVHLFGNTGMRKNPIARITDLVNPLSALLQFRLGGTLEKQRWRSIYDPRKLIPGL